DDTASLLLAGVAAGLLVGIFEELGWTGFAIPGLRLRHGVLATGLSVGVVWGAWHVLAFWEGDTLSGALPLALLLARLFAWLPAYRVLMVRVYDRTGSLLVAMLMHASLVFSISDLQPSSLAAVPQLTYVLCWAAVLSLVVAPVAVANRGQRAREHSCRPRRT